MPSKKEAEEVKDLTDLENTRNLLKGFTDHLNQIDKDADVTMVCMVTNSLSDDNVTSTYGNARDIALLFADYFNNDRMHLFNMIKKILIVIND